MIEDIINDAKTEESEAIYAEEKAQKAYEVFVKESNASIEAKTKDLINKTDERSKDEASKAKTDTKLDKAILELEQLADTKGQLHVNCDFLMKNFESRQASFEEEVEALKEAEAIFSGAIGGA